MKTQTEIVKEKLKKIEELKNKTKSYYPGYEDNPNEFIDENIDKIKSTLLGMQTAIKSELEWLKLHRDSDNACFNLKNLKPKSKKFGEGYKASLECQIGIYDKRITDCKNVLKLIENERK